MIPPSPEGHNDDQRQDGALHESVTQAALLRDGPLQTQQQSQQSSHPITSQSKLFYSITFHLITYH